MNDKKYEILMDEKNTIEFKGRTLHRIRALKDFGDIKKDYIGGFVENENNLSHKGNCWIYDNAKAMDDSRIYNNSKMCGNSEMHNNSRMYDNSVMFDNSIMYNNSKMYDNSRMCDNSELKNSARLYGKLISKVDDFVEISNPNGRIVTCVKKGDKILYNVGCQNEITEETFKDRIENKNGGLEENPHRKFYYKIIEASKTILLNE